MEPVEAVVSEYGYTIPEGLHRCSTKTTSWFLKPDVPGKYRDRLESTCDGAPCIRDFHMYKMQNINALLVIADPADICKLCPVKPYFDRPVEGIVPTMDQCYFQ